MKRSSSKSLAMLIVLVGALGLTCARAAIPADSVLQLQITLTGQDGRPFALASRAGRPQILSFIFTSCQNICPLIVDTLRLNEKQLTPAEQQRLRVLLVSIDPQNDTSAVLKRYAAERRLDLTRWTLARTDEIALRKLSALLGIKYRRIDATDFSHSAVLILLDGDGRVIARTEKMGAIDPNFMQALRRTLAASG
jgi:protein SCO1